MGQRGIKLSRALSRSGPAMRATLFHGVTGAPKPPRDASAWEAELPEIVRHGLAPTALDVLTEHALDLPHVHARLKGPALSRAAVRLNLEGKLTDATDVLDRAGIPALLIKGPALAAAVPALASRSFSDLDVLVPRDRYDEATEALLRNGFEPAAREWEPRQGIHDRLGHARTLTGPIPLDLHRFPSPPVFGIRVRFDRLLSSARTIGLHGRDVRTPSLVDLTVLTILHSISALKTRHLAPWRDVAHLLQAADPAETAQRFAEYEVSACLRFVVQQLRLCDLEIPYRSTPHRARRFDRARIGVVSRGTAHHRELRAATLPLPWAASYMWAYVFPEHGKLRERLGADGLLLMRWWAFCLRRLRQREAASSDESV